MISHPERRSSGIWSRLLPNLFGAVAVEGASMAPTFNRGDWLIVRRFQPRSKPRVRVGDILLIEREELPGALVIKRLTAIRSDSPNRHYPTYWVEGDNKEISQDSRAWGALDGEEIVGKVLFRYRRAAK